MGKQKQLISQRQYGKLRGLSSSWISKLVRDGKIPTTAGRIDVAAADRALGDAATDNDGVATFAEAQRRWRLATAELRELELRQKSGGLVSVAEVQKELERTLTNVRTRLLAIPVKMAPLMASISVPAECERLLRSEIYSALEFLVEHCVDRDFRIPDDALGTGNDRPV